MGQQLSHARSQSSRGSTVPFVSLMGWEHTDTPLPYVCKVLKNLITLATATDTVHKALGAPLRCSADCQTIYAPCSVQTGGVVTLGDTCHRFEHIIKYHGRVIAVILSHVTTGNITIVCSHAKSNGDLLRVLKHGVVTVAHTEENKAVNMHGSVWRFVERQVWPQVLSFLNSKITQGHITQSEIPVRVNLLGMSMGGMILQILAFRLSQEFTPHQLLITSPVLMLATPRVANEQFYEFMAKRNIYFINVSCSQQHEKGLTLDPVVTLGSKTKLVSSPVYVGVHGIHGHTGIYGVDPHTLSWKMTTLPFLLKYKHLHSRHMYQSSLNAVLNNYNSPNSCNV